jgi:hypothetical protein
MRIKHKARLIDIPTLSTRVQASPKKLPTPSTSKVINDDNAFSGLDIEIDDVASSVDTDINLQLDTPALSVKHVPQTRV